MSLCCSYGFLSPILSIDIPIKWSKRLGAVWRSVAKYIRGICQASLRVRDMTKVSFSPQLALITRASMPTANIRVFTHGLLGVPRAIFRACKFICWGSLNTSHLNHISLLSVSSTISVNILIFDTNLPLGISAAPYVRAVRYFYVLCIAKVVSSCTHGRALLGVDITQHKSLGRGVALHLLACA